MSDVRVPGLGLIVLLGLLSGLLWTSARETSPRCAQFPPCSKGLKCCDDRCCREDDLFSGPLSEVVLKPALFLPPTEPPPPYSLNPEDHAGTQRAIDNPASGLPPPR
ncbi:transmembrane protein 92 [Fukomys damarensis]|uniref:transmembrane protein 92 n=1 Tax=Fukomys damarensis TaxID=885580 RepID=UPI00053F5119|nr:transmembrane protein 92 [Fukomys damarensis]